MAVLESPEVLYLAAAVFGGKAQIGFETACVRLRLLCFQTSYFVNLAFLHILYHKMLFFQCSISDEKSLRRLSAEGFVSDYTIVLGKAGRGAAEIGFGTP